jgi:hypothetical protein
MTRRKKGPLRTLTAEERTWLERISRSQSEAASHVARAKQILRVADGSTYQEAAIFSGRKAGDAASNLVKRFNQEGLNSIQPLAAEWCTGKSDPVSDQLPVVVADIPTEGIVKRFVVCSAAGSYDPHRYPVGFIWDFGDGPSKQHRPEAIHIYEKPGTDTITLTVTTGTRHSTKSTEVSIREP